MFKKSNLNKLKTLSVAMFCFFILILMCMISACHTNNTHNTKIEVKDLTGKTFTFDQPISKVVSTHNPTLNDVIVLGHGTSKYLGGAFANKDKADGLYSLVLDDWNQLTPIGGNGVAVNKETIAKIKPDLALVPERFEKLTEGDWGGTGVDVFITLPNQESFAAIKDTMINISMLFNEEKRAKEVNEEFDNIINEAKNICSKTQNKHKCDVMFMGSSRYSIAYKEMIQSAIIDAVGAHNVVEGNYKPGDFAKVDAETIVKLNPEVIWIPPYAKYNAQDIINDEKLQSVSAVKSKRVFMFPSKLEPWDYPTVSACLGVCWAAYNLHPDLYTKEKLMDTCNKFYKLLYNRTFSEDELGIQ